MLVIFVYIFLFQVVSQYSNLLAPICVDSVLKVIEPANDTNVNLNDVKVVPKLGLVT